MEFICPVLVLLGAYWFFNCGYKLTTVQEGSIWGMTFPMSEKQKAWKKRNILKLILGIVIFCVCIGPGFGALIVCLFNGFFGLLYTLVCVVGFFAAVIMGTKKAVEEGKSMVMKELRTEALGALPMIQAVEAQLSDAQTFIVTYEGIGLVDKTNYCFASFMYGDYRLGTLSTPAEMAILATYFSQKYRKEFVGNPSWDRTFYPGRTVAYLGAGGVYVNKTPSSMTSKLNSYVFTRLK